VHHWISGIKVMKIFKSDEAEPSLTPPDPGPNHVADCGHEVVYTDHYDQMRGTSGGVYEWEGLEICPDCAEDLINSMSRKELMSLLGSEFKTLEEIENGA
jgi:hypothetical protein